MRVHIILVAEREHLLSVYKCVVRADRLVGGDVCVYVPQYTANAQ